ncbi:MAG: 5-oxoprolinase/urea amidolyase family protein [Burkholderiaceae bacterium]|nr:5-oxoprolinase/urea amidolyase family protein [Microbacteriaceae bacterium]
MRFLPVRDDALLIELDDLDQTLALVDALGRDPIAGVGELIPGARTLLVHYRPSTVTPARIVASVRGRDLTARSSAQSRLVEIRVRYDGEDLADVAAILGVSEEALVAMHTGGDYSVGFTGFAPGFGYLSGGHPALDVPRRPTPRTRIPAGSVALAGTFSGIYPRESPGGWQLIGTTDSVLWDLARDRPALLEPGDRVRFVDVTGAGRADVAGVAVSPGAAAPAVSPVAAAPALEVLSPGLLTVLEDLGRAGFASLGVSASGALDTVSLRAANRLAGNPVGTAGLEILLGGLRVRARGDVVVALAGAPTPLTVTGRRPRSPAFGTTFALEEGDELTVGALGVGARNTGARSYLVVRGGFAVEPVLGSLSTDLLSGLGPDPLREGTVLPVRESPTGVVDPFAGNPLVDLLAAATDPDGAVVLDVVAGPRTDWFTADALDDLGRQEWTVTPRSNRVGLRLAGNPLERVITGELPSEGTVSGAIQLPPDGQPVLFLADHPLTGGYPVIGAVATHHLHLAGQLPTGARIRFRPLGAFAEHSASSPVTDVPVTDAPVPDSREVPR